MVREHPGAFVVVTGCYAQLEAEAVSRIEGVDLVLGSNEKAELVQFLSDAFVNRSLLQPIIERRPRTSVRLLHRVRVATGRDIS